MEKCIQKQRFRVDYLVSQRSRVEKQCLCSCIYFGDDDIENGLVLKSEPVLHASFSVHSQRGAIEDSFGSHPGCWKQDLISETSSMCLKDVEARPTEVISARSMSLS